MRVNFYGKYVNPEVMVHYFFIINLRGYQNSDLKNDVKIAVYWKLDMSWKTFNLIFMPETLCINEYYSIDLFEIVRYVWKEMYEEPIRIAPATPNFWNEKTYTANLTLTYFYVSPDVLENPTYDPNSVSNIFEICSILPDFLTGMTLITFLNTQKN